MEDSLAVAQRNSESERVILFLKLTEGTNFTDSLVKTIKSQIRDRLSPRHVPALILETKDIPVSLRLIIFNIISLIILMNRSTQSVEKRSRSLWLTS